ncbi:MAG: hypothetical protein LBH81_02525 [Rickettsiales bacterium]|jgi:hypothetical protein|nr:hypothetical protein [Rickettsiales bacterium]
MNKKLLIVPVVAAMSFGVAYANPNFNEACEQFGTVEDGKCRMNNEATAKEDCRAIDDKVMSDGGNSFASMVKEDETVYCKLYE